MHSGGILRHQDRSTLNFTYFSAFATRSSTFWFHFNKFFNGKVRLNKVNELVRLCKSLVFWHLIKLTVCFGTFSCWRIKEIRSALAAHNDKISQCQCWLSRHCVIFMKNVVETSSSERQKFLTSFIVAAWQFHLF